LREQLERLVALQSVDLRIQEMEQAKASIPRYVETLEEDLRKEEERVSASRAELEKLQKDRRQKEKDLEEEIDRVKKTESRVYEIKTNKEYQAVLKEIENAKKLNRQREEEILEILERLEELQKNLIQSEQNLEGKRRQCQEQIKELKEREASFAEEMAGEVRQKEEQEKNIPPELLNKYHMLLEKRQGVAVARVAHGVCLACHMNLRPQLFIEIQKKESLIFCPNCSRILVWDNGSTKGQEL
jgi:predicted  nucleic acid-binding Zn-ribbon protein